MMKHRIVFVGVHNKPRMEPLDSRTRTGKVVDRIITRIMEVEPEITRCLKTNLYNIDYFPERRTRAVDIEWVHDWMERIMWTETDTIVTLGHCVNECFRWAKVPSVKVCHPAAVWSIEGRQKYVDHTYQMIREATTLPCTINILKSLLPKT